jgi:lysozyme
MLGRRAELCDRKADNKDLFYWTDSNIYGRTKMSLFNAVIDLSHHNTVTDFQAAKDHGVLGIVHKATEGSHFVDAKYDERRTKARKVGLLWGAYHFGVRGDVQGQVRHFLDIVSPGQQDLLVLDFEPNPREGTMTLPEAEAFVEQVQREAGRFPGLYAGESFLREKLGNRTDTILANCFLWVAKYSTTSPRIPPAFKTFTFWQYTDGSAGPQPHQVEGIGRCDRDKFNGDEAGLRRLWGATD